MYLSGQHGVLMGPLHEAFVALGFLTALSAVYFALLRPEDGANVSHHKPRPTVRRPARAEA
jgi:hypothetical protein